MEANAGLYVGDFSRSVIIVLITPVVRDLFAYSSIARVVGFSQVLYKVPLMRTSLHKKRHVHFQRSFASNCLLQK